MPFRSKRQQRFMFATMPETAKEWAEGTDWAKLPEKVRKKKKKKDKNSTDDVTKVLNSTILSRLCKFADLFAHAAEDQPFQVGDWVVPKDERPEVIEALLKAREESYIGEKYDGFLWHKITPPLPIYWELVRGRDHHNSRLFLAVPRYKPEPKSFESGPVRLVWTQDRFLNPLNPQQELARLGIFPEGLPLAHYLGDLVKAGTVNTELERWVPDYTLKSRWTRIPNPFSGSEPEEKKKALIGSVYLVDDISLDREFTYEIVPGDKITNKSPDYKLIGQDTPYGIAFAKAKEGDTISVQLASGFKKLLILEAH